MSTVALRADFNSNIKPDDLKAIARKWNITISNESDLKSYLLLVQSAEAVFRELEKDEDDYLDAKLGPTASLNARQFWRPEKRMNPKNAWSHRCNIQASDPVSQLLRGRSIVVKDNISVAGLPTTVGAFASLLSADGTFPCSPIDATVVRRVLEAGAWLKGTATCEMYSAAPLSFTSASGPVDNAWISGYTSGGSSSGCGSLMGMNAYDPDKKLRELGERVDLAIGGDQGGSIRIPASYNGVYGLKPTHGLVPYTGAASLTPMIDHLGPMASDLRDVALLLEAIAGYDGFDPRMTAEAPLRPAVPSYTKIVDMIRSAEKEDFQERPLRVGLIKESFEVPKLSDEVHRCVQEAALSCFSAIGASVKEVSIPLHTQGPAIWTAATRMSMGDLGCANQVSSFLEFHAPQIAFRWPPDQDMYEKLTATNPSIMNLIFSTEYLKTNFANTLVSRAHRKVFRLRKAYDDALEDFDVLITPTTPTVAMPQPEIFQEDGSVTNITERVELAVGIVANTCPFNITGHPAISVPCGFGKVSVDGIEKNLPVGMQMIARRWDEEGLFRAASLFEKGQIATSESLKESK